MPPKSSKLNENDFIFESTDDIFKKKQGKNQTQFFEEEEDRKTEPKLKEFFNDIEDENGEDLEDMGREEITETKKMKKGKITKEDVKVPIQKKSKNSNYQYEEENVDIEEENQEEEEESEESPQYIIEAESYISPTIRYIDEKRAEDELLNGIQTCLMINGQDKKGVLFLGENETIIFLSFENKKETIISLNNIKRIYFNIKGSSNLRNYNKKSNNERFIQFVDLNNKKTDFKFNNDTELEYFIKGLIKSYKNKTPSIDKNIIYEKNSKYFIKTTEKKDQKGKYTFTNKSNKYITDKSGKKEKHAQSHYKRRNINSNEDNNNNEKKNASYNYNYKKVYNEKKNYETDENKDNYINSINNENYNEDKEGDYNENYEENYNEFNEENNNENYENENNEENNENKDVNYNENYNQNYNENYNKKYNYKYNENYENNEENNEEHFEEYTGNNENYENYQDNGNDNDDDFVTTTKIEVYKDGKLINEETQEEYGGVVRTVHSYRPDIGEYEEFLRKSTIKKNNISDDDINRSIKRVKNVNKF